MTFRGTLQGGSEDSDAQKMLEWLAQRLLGSDKLQISDVVIDGALNAPVVTFTLRDPDSEVFDCLRKSLQAK